ncbi:helix-turn-helix domain-containing protein [Tissierella pigra]|uniref:Helix-turn-helix transcriptional regulator n=1 Tax=Tissierella pigra TaxID=2607614 RepID=A0A6N7XHW6_9FIRM|nr:AraC family transcriptional regulator [Tissierella pigra]MSU01641.1 helix-turn-helix transcriptional regulator [Tissierella pigra]
MSWEEKTFLGDNITTFSQSEDCTIYRMKDKSGDGIMTAIKVFPGIILIYNDFHMESCSSQFHTKANFLCIDFCREGRMEWKLDNDTYVYMKAGDLQINHRENHIQNFGFPLNHYHGISLVFHIEEAEEVVKLYGGFSIDLAALSKKFFMLNRPFIIQADKVIAHIFLELYTIPNKIKDDYLKIKILELLLHLSILEIPKNFDKRPYYYKTQVEKVKAIQELITTNLEDHYTLDELSEKFNIPLTSMKLCFKGVYGTSIYSYIRVYRMNKAAIMLRQTKENISEIAHKVGYDNSSKFASAFRSVIGKSPKEYRNSIV